MGMACQVSRAVAGSLGGGKEISVLRGPCPGGSRTVAAGSQAEGGGSRAEAEIISNSQNTLWHIIGSKKILNN